MPTRASSRCRWARASSSTGRPAPPGRSPARAGIAANNSGFTAGNPAAPQGTQVAFLQSTGSFSQTTGNWVAGNYVLSFNAAQRGNFQASQQDFQVLVDGVVVGKFTPSGTSYETYSTPVFTVAAGSHTITFQGLDSAGGDNTAFVDSIVPIDQSAIADTGFEQVQVGAGQFQYRPTGSPWTFSGSRGHRRQQQRLHRRQPSGARRYAGRVPPDELARSARPPATGSPATTS